MRRLIGVLEWALRPTVLDRGLPEVAVCRRDVAYGEDAKHRLDLIGCPGSEPAPLLVYVHGGAWVTGDKSNFKWITHSFARAGLAVFSINYRWAPEADLFGQLRDVARAIGWARANAPELGGDPDRVFLAGDSAGAHLVSWLHMALQRARSGIAAAKARGKEFGRRLGQRQKSDRLALCVLQMVGDKVPYRKIAPTLGLSKNTVGDIVKRERLGKTRFVE